MPYLKLDDALVGMIEWARERLQKLLDQAHCGTDPWEADIQWDYPIQGTDVLDDVDMEATHAVGFIAGVAAAFNVTPLELLDVVKHLPGRASNPAPQNTIVAGIASVHYPRTLTNQELMRVQGFADKPTPKAARPRAKRRQKIRTIK